jgi:uncharacterized protein (DUF433 family)
LSSDIRLPDDLIGAFQNFSIHLAEGVLLGESVGPVEHQMKSYEDRIVRDPKICGGEPVFKGTRVTLRTVLASLAAGDSAEDIVRDFPSLKAQDVQAAVAFAAASAEEDLPIPEVPHIR